MCFNDKNLIKKIVIYGPTGCGKSDLAIELAKEINAEIISADSVQIYKYLNIGSAKVINKKGIVHHMLDIISPDQEYSVKKYYDKYSKILKQTKKNIIIVGGSSFYLHTIINGLPNNIDKNKNLRKKLNQLNNKELFSKLLNLDQKSAIKIGENDKPRLIRSLEINILSKQQRTELKTKISDDFLKFLILPEKKEIHKNIELRVEKMLKEGLIEECEEIYKKFGYLKIIGYKEIFDWFEKKISFETAIENIKTNTKKYSKKQITWLNKMEGFIKLKSKNKIEEIKKHINY